MACAAYGCKNAPRNKAYGITFHRFPSDPYRRQQWVLAVRRANWAPSYCSLLCSTHFEERMFDRSSCLMVQLKSHAVPTIFEGEGYPTIKNQDLLTPKTVETPLPCFVKQEVLECVEPLENISSNKNRILVVPEELDIQATFYNSDGKNNVVIIKDEEDLETVLNYGNEDDIDGNRAIIVSDGSNTKTEWCGNGDKDSYLDDKLPLYDPKFGEQSLKSNHLDYSKIRNKLAYDPNFYVRRVKKLKETIKKLQAKKKVLRQISRRKQRRILKFHKQLKRMKKYTLPPKCSTQPIVHVISQVVND